MTFLVILSTGLIALVVGDWSEFHEWARTLNDPLPSWINLPVYALYSWLYYSVLNPGFLGAMGVILGLEFLFPAKPKQKVLSSAFIGDSLWLPIQVIFNALVLFAFIDLLQLMYTRHVGFLSLAGLEGVAALPNSVRWVWGILLADFGGWLHHWIRHRIPFLWQLHTVHHSQRQMNMFTDVRYHLLEYLVDKTITVVPLMVLQVPAAAIVPTAFFFGWFTKFYHANIRTDLSVLKYVFVTPQSHRIHHSRELRHRDRNFGVYLSIWDRLLGTHYEGSPDEYPETGLSDEEFPPDSTGIGLLLDPLRQHVLPLTTILAPIRAHLLLRGRG